MPLARVHDGADRRSRQTPLRFAALPGPRSGALSAGGAGGVRVTNGEPGSEAVSGGSDGPDRREPEQASR
ncbi:hypothetical protein Asi02nite_27630 [Asanoa siamensis]|uniref:Uncharacterized protein n=1 Tax=Asanoa siamensis TaxID=926357 RepID=A0ABQ4CPM4_9ACTN|nr:hypothetical protein Asi02nite_27630 [Asanoa siamensis]